jgi:hypothetical protein
MREVFSGDMVSHVWAAQTQQRGRRSDGRVFFDGRKLYSYGSHFVSGYMAPGPVALLNADRYSVSTSRHVSDARRASRQFPQYMLPSLTDLAGALDVAFAAYPDGKMTPEAKKLVQREVRAYLTKEGLNVSEDAAAYLLTVAGLPASAWTKAKADKAKADAADAAADAWRGLRDTLWQAATIADMSDDAFRASWPIDDRQWPIDAYTLSRIEATRKLLFRVHKAAKAATRAQLSKAGVKIGKAEVAKLAARLKEYRAHAATTQDRAQAAEVARLTADFNAWKAGAASRPTAWRYGNGLPGLSALMAEIEADVARENAEAHAAAFIAWKEGTGARPYHGNYAEGSSERAEIEADKQREQAELLASYDAWTLDATQPRPASRPFLCGPLHDARPNAWSKLHTVEADEQREAARLKTEAEKAEKEATFKAWLAGESVSLPSAYREGPHGSAYVRRRGDYLETSQGASVPWSEAVKAFRFIKLCRARGEGFKANGKTIRVGHFSVDSISRTGNMQAGCHYFRWEDIEALAVAQGVFDLEPSADAVVSSHS